MIGKWFVLLDKDVQNKIYDDVISPSAKKVGESIWDIICLITSITLPIKYLNNYTNLVFQKNIHKLESRLETVEEKNIISILPDIWVPVLEKLTYTSCEKISDMFIELLKKASNKEEISEVHPKYINIVSSLAEDEALILEYFYKNDIYRLPFLNLHFIYTGKEDEYAEIVQYFNTLPWLIKLIFPDNIQSYINNLNSLWLIQILDDKFIPDKEEYKPYEELENSGYIKNIESKLDVSKWRIDHKKWVFLLTNLWKSFLKAVFTGK